MKQWVWVLLMAAKIITWKANREFYNGWMNLADTTDNLNITKRETTPKKKEEKKWIPELD